MNSINISINSLYNDYNIYIDCKNNIIILNNSKKNITQEDIDNLLRIIRTWNSQYVSNNIIDGEKTRVEINTNEGIYTIECNGDYPQNYQALKDWINELYDR